MKNLFEIHGEMYETSRLARNLKEVRVQKLEKKQRSLRTFSKFAHDVMPAGCGLDFEGISSPQSTAITARNTNS